LKKSAAKDRRQGCPNKKQQRIHASLSLRASPHLLPRGC